MTSTTSTKSKSRPTTQDRLPKKQPRTVTVGIYADNQLGTVYDQAMDAVREAEDGMRTSREARIGLYLRVHSDEDFEQALAAADAEEQAALFPLRAAAAEAEDALEKATIWFTFRGIGARRMKELAREHPPTDEDLADHERLGGTTPLEYSPDGFHQALLEASCVAPAGYDWAEVWSGSAWNNAEIEALVAHAINANQAVRTATHRPAPRYTG